MRPLAIISFGVLALAGLLWGLLSMFRAPPPAEPDRLILTPIEVRSLAGWASDDVRLAIAPFLRSCDRWQGRPQDKPLTSARPAFGTYGAWRPVCDQARQVPLDDPETARRFFEDRFVAFTAANHQDTEGLFTGYYEPELRGSRTKSDDFGVPLYQRPADLIMVDLGDFRADLRGRRVAGRVDGIRLRPYAARAEIERAPSDAHEPLVWVDSAVDAFFLHIQGSGRVVLDDGQVMRVGYAAQNGHPYTAIGRVLVRDGHMALEEVTMQSIRQWLDDNPDQAAEVMNTNSSYVYFREIIVDDETLGPLGAQSVALTPGRSLAVDLKHWGLGLPLWLDTSWPPEPTAADANANDVLEGAPLQRLMVAQDTGGAIRGPVRGDVFLGFGADAGDVAGRMKQPGRLAVFLPKEIAADLMAGQ